MNSADPASKQFGKTQFQSKYIIQYDLYIASCDARFSKVIAVRCRFCICFGHEKVAKKSLKFEGCPFITNNYMQQLCINHQVRWKEYQKFSTKDKFNYFAVAIKHAKNICHVFQSSVNTHYH